MAQEVNPLTALVAFVAKHKTQRLAAEALGVTQAFLSGMLKHRTPISPKVLQQLGLKRVVVRVSKGRAA